ncbi:MAG: ATP-binding protein [Acidobacteriota bacterium]
MDDATLESLRRALEATPDNPQLRMVLVGAHLERQEPQKAYDLVRDLDPATLIQADHRLLAARACLAADDADRALTLADDESPEGQLLRAKIFLAKEQHKEGLAAYRAAVAENPALEDLDLRDRLAVNVRSFPQHGSQGGHPRLRVISNDDTDESEVSRLLMPQEESVDFSDVGGLDEIKRQIHKRIILPFQKPSLFERFKKRVGGGILLYGPPGCGKTLLARATAGECEATFLNVAIADVLDMYIGESERKLQAIFEKARASTPAVLFFDEIEALGGKRQYTREATSSKLVSQFLSEMDGFSRNNSGVLILAATNVPWAVDSAFRRPGRFDRLLFVPPPDRPAREAILEIRLADRPQEEAIDLAHFAKRTSGFSGADLDHLVETASDEAIEASIDSGEEVPIRAAHLRTALKAVKPTTLEWLTTARNYARYANEAGQYDDVLDFLKKHGR